MSECFTITIPNSVSERNFIKITINKRLNVERKKTYKSEAEINRIYDQGMRLNNIKSNNPIIELNKNEILYLLKDFEENVHYCPYEEDAKLLGLEEKQGFYQKEVLDKIYKLENPKPYEPKNLFIRENLLFREFYCTKDIKIKENIVKEIKNKYNIGDIWFFNDKIYHYKENECERIIYLEESIKLIKIIKDKLIKENESIVNIHKNIEINDFIDDVMSRIDKLENRIKGIDCTELKKELETMDTIIKNLSKDSTSKETSKKYDIDDSIFMKTCKRDYEKTYALMVKLNKAKFIEYDGCYINISQPVFKKLLSDIGFSDWILVKKNLHLNGKEIKTIDTQAAAEINNKNYIRISNIIQSI